MYFLLKPCSLQSLEVPSIIKHCEFAAIILSSARLKQRVVSLRNSRSSISLSGARARVPAPVSRGMHLSVQGWFRQGFFLWPLWCPSDPPCPAHCFTTGRWLVEKNNVRFADVGFTQNWGTVFAHGSQIQTLD